MCVCGCAYWSVSSLGNNINMRLLCQSISPLTILRHRKLIFWQPEVLGVPPQPPPPHSSTNSIQKFHIFHFIFFHLSLRINFHQLPFGWHTNKQSTHCAAYEKVPKTSRQCNQSKLRLMSAFLDHFGLPLIAVEDRGSLVKTKGNIKKE